MSFRLLLFKRYTCTLPQSLDKYLTTNILISELALVTHKPRAASVYAVGRVKVAGK